MESVSIRQFRGFIPPLHDLITGARVRAQGNSHDKGRKALLYVYVSMDVGVSELLVPQRHFSLSVRFPHDSSCCCLTKNENAHAGGEGVVSPLLFW